MTETKRTDEHPTSTSGWKAFWDKGGFWRAVLLGLMYVAVYLAAGNLTPTLFPGLYDSDDIFASAGSVFWAYVWPLIVGLAFLLLFGATVGWTTRLFARQPIGGSWWMWILPAVVLAGNAMRYATTDYAAFAAGVVLMTLAVGVCVGLAEEILTRGYFVNMLRAGGHRELVVALVSSLMFAGLHAINALSGASLFVLANTLVYTFAFGVAMYLTLRVTRNLLWPVLLHATTDPAIFLQTEHPAEGGFAAIAAQGNFPVIILGLILVWFVRGRVEARPGRVTEDS
jgi:hypothetical protein